MDYDHGDKRSRAGDILGSALGIFLGMSASYLIFYTLSRRDERGVSNAEKIYKFFSGGRGKGHAGYERDRKDI